MCVLAVLWRCGDSLPLVVAANRDEERARRAAPPVSDTCDGVARLAPRDLRAGGTWEGLTARGLALVITNRRDGDFDAARPSRGELCRDALAHADAPAVAEWLGRRVQRRRYNSFNLFFADRDRAFVASWNGAFEIRDLDPGVHTLSNLHPLDALRLPELDDVGGEPLPALRRRLVRMLASHARRDDDFQVCKHGARYGTVSSSLMFVPAAEPPWMEYADGPPCTTPFATHAVTPQAVHPAPRR